MSDKNTYNKDFVNRAWEDMSTILDKEMPVRKKKRRFLFLFCFLGIVTCGGIVWLGLYSASSANVVSLESNSNSSLNSNSNSSSDNILFYDLDEKVQVLEHGEKELVNPMMGDVAIKALEKTTAVLENTSAASTRTNESENEKLLESEVFVEKAKMTSKILKNEATTIIVTNENDSKTEKLSKPKVLIEEPKTTTEVLIKDKSKEKEKLHILQPIAFANTTNLEWSEEKKLPFNSKFRRWKFGFETGLVFQNKNEIGGKLAWIANRKMKRNWMFHTGLEYNVQFVNYSIIEQAAISMDPPINSQLQSMDLLDILQLSPTRINSHFIKIPVLMGYKFNESFELTGGILGSMVLYSGIGFNSAIRDYIGLEAFVNGAFNRKRIAPIFDIQSSIGLTYYPSKKWAINLRYDNGFLQRAITYKRPLNNKIGLRLEKYNSRNRQLSLSARMYF